MGMLQTFRNAWKVQDLRKKILYTLLMLLVYRIGCLVPVPGVNTSLISEIVSSNGILQMMNILNGGTLSSFTLLATGVSPYITASIVIQLLTVAIPKLEAMQKEEDGRKALKQWTRILGIIMSAITSIGLILTYGSSVLRDPVWYNYLFIAILNAAGTAFAVWCGEKMTEKGIGNGLSLLIFVNVVSTMPGTVVTLVRNVIEGAVALWILPVALVIAVVIIFAVVFMDLGERRIPVQYAQRVVGRRVYGGQSTYIPMRVNGSGVMPLIFANTILQVPASIALLWPASKFTAWYTKWMSSGTVLYAIFLALFIVFFAYFYATIAFNAVEISKNLQQQGGFIPGIRPGKPTSDFMLKINSKITLFSALFLAVLALLPQLLTTLNANLPTMAATSILIAVSVALETTRALDSQLMMRNYRGFLK